jgi:hypothetical protein
MGNYNMKTLLLIGVMVVVPAQANDVCALFGSTAKLGAVFRDSNLDAKSGSQLVQKTIAHDLKNAQGSEADKKKIIDIAVNSYMIGYNSDVSAELIQELTVTICNKEMDR